jgi:CHAT domain-containing protein/tetratricopeptide (TPR) repeat protein
MWASRFAAVILKLALVAIAVFGLLRSANGQGTDEFATLNRQVEQLYREGKYEDAISLAQHVLELAKQRGPDHPDVASSLNSLAELFRKQGRFAEAEPLHRQALSIRERMLRPNHPDIDMSLNYLVEVYRGLNQFGDAQLLYEHWLGIREKALGNQHPLVGRTLNDFADLFRVRKRWEEAEPLYKRALVINENASHLQEVARSLGGLAECYSGKGIYADAERFYRRLLLVQETLGRDRPEVAVALSGLAGLYVAQSRFADAEVLYKRLLPIEEKTKAPELFAITLQFVAQVYIKQGHFAEAEPHLRRALAITEKNVTPSDPRLTNSLESLAELYRNQKRFADAERLLKRALSLQRVAKASDQPWYGTLLKDLGGVYADQGRFAEAELLFKQAFIIKEKALGPDQPEVANSLSDLGGFYRFMGFYRGQRYYAKAEPLLKRALAILQHWYGPDHPWVTWKIRELVELYMLQENWSGAVEFLRRIRDTEITRSRLAGDVLGKSPISRDASDFVDSLLIQAAYRLDSGDQSHVGGIAQEMFVTAQWARKSVTAASLAQMAARQVTSDVELSRRVRQRQDLVNEWRTLDQLLLYSSEPPDRRDASVDQGRRDRMMAINQELAATDTTLDKDFPDYTAVANPDALSIAGVQARLGNDEALVLFLDAFGHYKILASTFVWVITKTDMRWVRCALGTKDLTAWVQKLRAGLERDARAANSSDNRAAEQIGSADSVHDFLPFDLAIAHELYSALLGQVADLIENKQLLIVPSGPLTSLPFHVLVTQKLGKAIPDTVEGYGKAAWLAKRNAITVLPSVASLTALRQHAKGGRAPDAYLGFGNPLLVGASGTDRRAWSVQSCANAIKPVELAARTAEQPRGISDFFRGASANIAAVRALAPLPETANELCAVARSLGGGDSAIALGEAATETAIKAMSADGRLARARVVHFATHGLVAGEVKGLAEPALVLTPPSEGTDPAALEQDDGLLTASEVAQLKLNADWVILSACNTAAGGAGNAEALSGLARAFFYAGARALLVSHWPVNSEAAVKLTTRIFAQKADIGRAEALRQAMLATIAEGGRSAHPSYWAPFVVVGEGGQ